MADIIDLEFYRKFRIVLPLDYQVVAAHAMKQMKKRTSRKKKQSEV